MELMKENDVCKRNLEKFSILLYFYIFKFILFYEYKLGCRLYLNIRSIEEIVVLSNYFIIKY